MIDVDGHDITEGIVKALSEEFGHSYKIYRDSVPQNFLDKSFYVRQTSGSNELIMGQRYRRRYIYVVTYFAGQHDHDATTDMQMVLSRLYPVLEYVTMDDQFVRASDMSHDTTLWELHVTLTYEIFVLRSHDRGDYMEILHQKQRVKEE